jgi:hypothetical protein
VGSNWNTRIPQNQREMRDIWNSIKSIFTHDAHSIVSKRGWEILFSKPLPMGKHQALRMGFKELPHATIGDIIVYDLGNDRQLSIGSIGTPNEMVTISQSEPDDYRKITDVVRLHNYDYDGYLTEERLMEFMSLKKQKKK